MATSTAPEILRREEGQTTQKAFQMFLPALFVHLSKAGAPNLDQAKSANRFM